MELEEYLKGVRECPDADATLSRGRVVTLLTAEYGIYDNWPIVLNADHAKVIEDIRSGNGFVRMYKFLREWKEPMSKGTAEYHRRPVGSSEIYTDFHDSEGTVLIQGRNFVTGEILRDETHSARQRENFNMSFMLHPYQKKKIKGVSNQRAMAWVIEDVCNYAMRNNIPLCLPKSMGWKYNDLSRIIYWPSTP